MGEIKFGSLEKKEMVEKSILPVVSDLETFEGKEKKEIEIKLFDGYPKAAAFFDIDGTLGNFSFIHGESAKKLFPNHDPEDVAKTHLAGGSLGTTYRVFHRSIGIFEEGKDEWRDPQKYWEWFLNHKDEVDVSGPAHDKASEYSLKHSLESARITEELYKKNPKIFDKTKLKPVFRLAEIYKRMGIPMAIMTANDEPFTRSICKCLNLSESFITSANQRDFEGKGKDAALENLVKKLKDKGIPIPKKLIVVGDSLNGDMGSGAKFMSNHPEYEVSGVLVGEKSVEEMKGMVKENPLLKEMPVEVLNPSMIEEKLNGQPNIGKYRKKYDTKN